MRKHWLERSFSFTKAAYSLAESICLFRAQTNTHEQFRIKKSQVSEIHENTSICSSFALEQMCETEVAKSICKGRNSGGGSWGVTIYRHMYVHIYTHTYTGYRQMHMCRACRSSQHRAPARAESPRWRRRSASACFPARPLGCFGVRWFVGTHVPERVYN